MNVLVACEYSGTVREAFRKLGHEAWSCDLLPAEDASAFHFQIDALEMIERNRGYFDLLIAHPPCTYLANSGVRWLHDPDYPDRWSKLDEGAAFFKALLDAPIDRIAVENPIPHKYAVERIGRRPDQYVQPYDFGDDASKKTGLWLKNLPPLDSTGFEQHPPAYYTDGKPRWSNQSPSGANKIGQTADRWKKRSTFWPGIARAMAEQWGSLT